MRKLLITFLLFPFFMVAQNEEKVDSLKLKLATYQTAGDLQKSGEVLFEIGSIYYDEQKDSLALFYTNQALAIIPATDTILTGRLLYRKGMLHYFLGKNQNQVLPLLDSAHFLLKHLTDKKILLTFLQTYGPVLNSCLHYDKGVEILKQAEQICLQEFPEQEIDNLLNIYSNILGAALATNNLDLALENARKGIEVGKDSDNFELRGDLHYNNGVLLRQFGMQEDAVYHYQTAIELFEQINYEHGIAISNMALGNIYTDVKQFEKAHIFFDKSLQYFNKAEDYGKLANLHDIKAYNFYLQQDFQQALKESQKAIQYMEKSERLWGLFGLYLKYARIKIALNELDEAAQFIHKELKFAEEIQNLVSIQDCYYYLSEIEEKKGNLALALAHHKEYVNTKDGIFTNNLEQKMAVERTRQNIEAAQEAQEKAELQAALLGVRNQLYLAIAIGLFLIILVFSYLFRQLQKTKAQLESKNLQLTQLNATKDKFFGIIAHDIRSPIVALDGVGEQMEFYLNKKNEPKLRRLANRVDVTAKRLSNLLDNLLSWALLQTGTIPYHPNPINLNNLVEDIFALYLPLANTKKISLENKISAKTEVFADESALHTILRNLVNNALKFTSENGQISIQAKEQNQKIFIEINDTGTGISAEKMPHLFSLSKKSVKGTAGEKGSGLGLMLCKELVELNKGTIKAISELGKGSRFIFSVPQVGSI